MVHPGLNLSKPSLQTEPHYNQLPQRNLELIKEKHVEQERIPADASLLTIAWTAIVASFFLIKSKFQR